MTDSAINLETRVFKEIKRIDSNRRAVRIWLIVVALAILALVLVGGATRLTDSGLSITEWKPIHGVIPPLNAAEWQEEFQLYQRIPEYSQVNKGMTVEEFKTIFWWEWAHRLIARSIGVIFALPLLFFWSTGRLESRLKWPLFGILCLGGLQGAIGWWMVSSGLSKRVDVSQYRLAIHLMVACVIFASVTWVWRALSSHTGRMLPGAGPAVLAGVIVLLVLLQIYLGALVAGLDAGLAYNTWPLMDGALIPGGLHWHSAFDDPKTVQFLHRMNAYLLLGMALIQWLWLATTYRGTTHANRAMVFFVLVCLQAFLGITTLILAGITTDSQPVAHMPIGWALAHQGCAILVLGFAIAHWRGFYGEYPRPTDVALRG
ncbi:MAG: cytochrome oxidase assembly protein [Rhizobium sp.]|nr:cytochrome oxidase assembly protein [Rhizobium sp.]